MAARRRHLQGWVALEFFIRADGVVAPSSIVVLSSSDTVFVDAARRVIQDGRFWPARRNGTTIGVYARQFVVFKLRRFL